MIFKEQPKDNYDSFQGCDPQLKDKLVEIVDYYKELIKEPRSLPPKREIQHEVQLQSDDPLQILACTECQSQKMKN